ncbi:MAG TPA: NAD-dependent epimerase/dehydratase family protein [Micropepsaceae bacterium]|nr:NAD-dependent epimerase/dehydratase family protein [Micropepsaceae bacterium]
MAILVTGAAGFIGHRVAMDLLARGEQVIGLDNFNTYYDPALKEARFARLTAQKNFTPLRCDISDQAALSAALKPHKINSIIHLAAQAGVRYSLENPQAYVAANVAGHLNLLEHARHHGVRHFVYASSSSVYGGNTKVPFSEDDRVDHPVSLYAATKRSGELISASYSHLYGIAQTGLRFFTVYGPWGRPDMAVWLFTEALFAGKPIRVFNNGDMARDFTFIDDIAGGVIRVHDATPEKGSHRIYNIGNNRPERLDHLIATLERLTNHTAIRQMEPMQPGDVYKTYADISALERDFGFRPVTPLDKGLKAFVDWYRNYKGL